MKTSSLCTFAICVLLASAGASRAEDVALTFDDLPTLSLTDTLDYTQVTTTELLAGLRRNALPATGFVNEGKLAGSESDQRTAILSQWLDAGMDLGNHSYSHLSLNKVPVDQYIADVARGGEVTGRLLRERGRSLRWFRYPYLETGLTKETRATFETWLAGHGYRVAPVTIENSDWMFALPYDDAVLRKDSAAAARIRNSYLAYTAQAVSWYRMAAFDLLERRPALVFLLHASRLNADSMDALAAILARNHLHAVTLDSAMSDPAYRLPDIYVGPDGDEWLSRWSLALNKDLPWSSFTEPPADIAAEDKRLDTTP